MTSNNKNAFNLNEGEKKIEKYVFSMKQLLGKGSYASVYRGRSIYDPNCTIAVKVIDKKLFANKYNLKNIQSQIEIMKKVDHPNIVKLLDIYQTNNNMYMVTEFCGDGDLNSYLKKKKKLTEQQATEFLRDIVSGFKYLNELGIVHRDLKPANILLSNGKCKLSDFGFARSLDYGDSTVLRSIVGTPLYMSPQILKHQTYTSKSDLWSVGLIFYELLHGHTPWPAHNETQLINSIYNKPVNYDSHISETSKDFIRKALKIKQDDRMNWQEAFNHPIIIKREGKSPAKFFEEDPVLKNLCTTLRKFRRDDTPSEAPTYSVSKRQYGAPNRTNYDRQNIQNQNYENRHYHSRQKSRRKHFSRTPKKYERVEKDRISPWKI